MSKRPIFSTAGSSAPPTNATKRRRSSPPQDQQHEPPPVLYPRLEAARFPPEILALPHILKQIDTYLMTANEAAVEAAKTGLADWLYYLLPCADNKIVAVAIVEASSRGHVECVEVLVEEYAVRPISDHNSWEGLLKAVNTAASCSHLDVLNLLLAEVSPGSHSLRKAELCGWVDGALLVAAKSGHLDMVKFIVQHTKEQDDPQYEMNLCDSSALARAISGCQTAVVEYLLGLEEFTWDLQEAFVAAVGVKDNALADRLYELYLHTSKKGELFIKLARDGHLDAVKYLYQAGHNDLDLVGEAFVNAAGGMGADVLEFLLNTGRVSSEAFDKGFKAAVKSTWKRMKMVSFLLDMKRASAKAINQAFVAASSTDILEIFLQRANILDESIRTVFKRATGNLDEYYSRREQEDTRIIKLLYKKDCIPADMIGKAFVVAASKGHSELVALLRGDGRITAEMMGEAFAATATRKKSDLMMSLYDHDISPEAILVAFSEAASRERICNVEELTELLSDGDRVPQELRDKAFVIAAQLKHDTVLQILWECSDGDWSLVMLKEALAVSKCEEVKNFIRKVICDQLFDPDVHGLADMVVKFMENRNGGSNVGR